jgi:hypothetical protein
VAQVETWLEGARVELGDTLAVGGDFPQSGRGEYTVFGKSTDLKARRVTLKLARAPGGPNAWAVDAGGSPHDSRALDQPGSEGCYAG